MKQIFITIFILTYQTVLTQDLIPNQFYSLETIGCPENKICESRKDLQGRLIFFQIFNNIGTLEAEYLRTDDSTFIYKSFHLMDHFELIKKPSYYGQRIYGQLRISNETIGGLKKAYNHDTYEPYNYMDTLLIPIGGWNERFKKGNLKERIHFNNQGEKQGAWDSYVETAKIIERVYEQDSLLSIVYLDEMSKEAESRQILKRLQGSWNVYSKWSNKHMEEIAVGQKKAITKSQYSIYSISPDMITVETFENGKSTTEIKKYKMSIDRNENLILDRKDKTVELKVLFLSDDEFRLLPLD